jgi:outer membrane protein assembly factor BamE (lipoprotein component of BamABCDE complex)
MERPSRPVNAMSASASRTAPYGGLIRRTLLALPAVLLLSGCSLFAAPEVQRGNRVTEDQLREITPGVQTKADIRALLGSPTQTSTFNDNQWYYISSRTRQRPARQLLVEDQKTVVVEFDERGVVGQVRVLTEADGQPVSMVSRETPTPGTERTLLQALFGNIGRVGTGATQPNIGPGTSGPPIGQIR